MANVAPVKWAQRSDSIYVTICLPDVKDESIELDAEHLMFKCVFLPFGVFRRVREGAWGVCWVVVVVVIVVGFVWGGRRPRKQRQRVSPPPPLHTRACTHTHAMTTQGQERGQGLRVQPRVPAQDQEGGSFWSGLFVCMACPCVALPCGRPDSRRSICPACSPHSSTN
jgi:hypothetical protein